MPGIVEIAESVKGDITIVNFKGSNDMLRQQIKAFREYVSVIEVLEQRSYFNKSAAQNLGAARTSHPLLFFTDCDIIYPKETLKDLISQLEQGGEITFATLASVTESETNSRGGKHITCFGYHLYLRTSDNRELRIIDNEEDTDTGGRQAPGLLLVRRPHFEAIMGYNSRLHGWGWEDQDMISRLTLGLGLKRIMSGAAVHISHSDEARVAHYPISDRWQSRDQMFRQALANYDNADFSGTFNKDKDILSNKIPGAFY